MQPYYLYSDLPRLGEHKAWAEIDTAALSYNYKLLCSLTPGVRHICAVKADSYGHISDICVRVLLRNGCDFFAVSCVEEAISVRKICAFENKDADILILGYTDPRQVPLLIENNIIQAVISEDYALTIKAHTECIEKKLRVHIAIDTGMNRIGICSQSDAQAYIAADAVERICRMDHLSVEGIFTHFAKADEDPDGDNGEVSHTRLQFERFERVRRLLSSKGIKLFSHACNSAAAVRFPQYALDGVRFGIMLYGVPPSVYADPGLLPVMSFHTVISHIHTVIPGESVGYGGKYQSDTERTVATLPIGYADGFLRAYKGFYVSVNTEYGNYMAPVIGNVCMDQCMIDVSGIPVKVGDKITVFGKTPDALHRLATLAETIEYEVLCLISARVPRIIK